MFSDEVLKCVDKSVLCWLATVSYHGIPNVSPKEIFAARGENELLVANVASPKSARNISVNPYACVSFLDIFVQKGFQVIGSAELVKKTDSRFANLAEPLVEMTQGKFPFGTIFRISATEVNPIVAPRYLLYPDTTEAEQIESALRTYGVSKNARIRDW